MGHEQKLEAWADRILARNNTPPKPAKKLRVKKLTCSDCGHEQQVTKLEMRHAARQRCEKCGGPLNFQHLA